MDALSRSQHNAPLAGLLALALSALGPPVTAAAGKPWVTHETELGAAASFSVAIARATARAEAEIIERHRPHMSTAMDLGGGRVLRGGGFVTHARCRQRFEVTEVIVGRAALGERHIEYGFVEKSDAFPGPREECPIPAGVDVILLLNPKGGIAKALPDTKANREAVKKHVGAVKRNIAAEEACESTRARLDDFAMCLFYAGPGDPHAFDTLTVKVPPIQGAIVALPIEKAQAAKLVEWLHGYGYFKRAERVKEWAAPKREGPSYELRLWAGPELMFCEDLGWDERMLSCLANLQLFLTGEAAEAMDRLLLRLATQREDFQEEAREVAAEIQRFYAQLPAMEGYQAWAKRGPTLRFLLPTLLASDDGHVVHEALLLARDRCHAPEAVRRVIIVLEKLLAAPEDAEGGTRRLACEVLGRYRDARAIPVLLKALADPYAREELVAVPGHGHAERQWFAVWRDADQALRRITGANPIPGARQRAPIQGQQEAFREAWQAWWQKHREGEPDDGPRPPQ